MKKFISVALLFCFFCAPVLGKSVRQSFDVEIGVFDAAKVDVAYDFDNSNYLFSSEIKTSGLFDKLYSFKAEYLTSGVYKNNKPVTAGYHQTTKSAAHLRTKSLIFDENGVLMKRQSAKDGEQKTVDIEKQTKPFDFYDIQSVLMIMLQNFGKTNSCTLDKTVFNSKKIYHIDVKDSGRVLFKDKKVNVSGQAHKCLAFIHQDDVEKGDLLWQSTAEKPIVFYLMKDEKTGAVFVPKVEIASTPLGDLEAYMTDLNIEE